MKVPEPSELAAIAKSSVSIATAWTKIDKAFDKIKNDKEISNSEFGNKCIAVWNSFVKDNKDDPDVLSNKATRDKNADIFFKKFIANYKAVFDKYKGQ